ncbi:hypothetical protein CJ030_MR7G027997 [Morella rubra]|uniref:Uncharacterized protein n=1 Tax=Morella rubra TaxID=262757 RepID=A0A6A1V1A7_9ROSI|nr:hypothetical protein CJ030_MR7G027997 [Morella rubra]
MATKGSPRGKAIVVTPYPLPQQDTSVQVEIVMPRTIQLPPILVENPLLGSFHVRCNMLPRLVICTKGFEFILQEVPISSPQEINHLEGLMFSRNIDPGPSLVVREIWKTTLAMFLGVLRKYEPKVKGYLDSLKIAPKPDNQTSKLHRIPQKALSYPRVLLAWRVNIPSKLFGLMKDIRREDFKKWSELWRSCEVR